MNNKHDDGIRPPTGLPAIPAGEFSQWLHATEAMLESGNGAANVPCGSCRGCCRSSMFIHIRPEETQTIQRIPRRLLVPAPGLPKGHLLMGYTDKGECPMLILNNCSIYEDRPQTCRDYDCRVFAATGISVDVQAQPEIAQRTQQWEFAFKNESSRNEHKNVQETAAFLEDNSGLFPQGSLPVYPVQLAALAVEVNKLFFDLKAKKPMEGDAISDIEIVQAILAFLSQPEQP